MGKILSQHFKNKHERLAMPKKKLPDSLYFKMFPLMCEYQKSGLILRKNRLIDR